MTDQKINDGGPAFAIPEVRGPTGDGIMEGWLGMSLRDWFAGQALSGIMAASAQARAVANPKTMVCAMAYDLADAMLKARETTND